MGADRTTPKVLEYLRDKTGMVIHYAELERAVNLNHTQVLNVIGTLRRNHPGSVSIIEQGSVFKWNGFGATNAHPIGKLYELLAHTKSGRILVQDEDGNLYTLTELE